MYEGYYYVERERELGRWVCMIGTGGSVGWLEVDGAGTGWKRFGRVE